MYRPNPIDTSDIKIPAELEGLVEKLAENVHEEWALARVNEGWTYGEVKDSEKMTTPCLLPYSELPESEKKYDRNTAMSTIKLLLKMGYKINLERD